MCEQAAPDKRETPDLWDLGDKLEGAKIMLGALLDAVDMLSAVSEGESRRLRAISAISGIMHDQLAEVDEVMTALFDLGRAERE